MSLTSGSQHTTLEDLPLQVLEHLLEGCQVIGRDYRYLYVNPVAAQEKDRGELLRKACRILTETRG
jgi:hypothetical protein